MEKVKNLTALTISVQHQDFTLQIVKKHRTNFQFDIFPPLQSIIDNSIKLEALHKVASTSGSLSIGTAGTLLLPLKREDILSMAEFSWLIFSFKVCLVLCFQEQQNIIITSSAYSNDTEKLNQKAREA